MPLQNRVNPYGEIEAVNARGSMMGNRGGKFHRDDKTLGKRRWATTHWICCDLVWKDQHHEPMGQGYTSLFFLDEVTALSAGHRPCFYCRRKEAKAFLGEVMVTPFDKQLHAERLIPLCEAGRVAGGTPDGLGLPSGAMIDLDNTPYAIKDHNLLRWTHHGYTDCIAITPTMRGKVLTPPSILNILKSGYSPRWHESALQRTVL
jgi:hypothetical protein